MLSGPNGSVSIMTILWAGWLENLLPCRGSDFSIQYIQTSFGAQPAFCRMGNGGSFHRVKCLGHEADHSPPSSAKFKNVCSWTSGPSYAYGAVLN
jgi:hypothetical protein